MGEDRAELATRLTELFNAGDREGLRDLLADDAEIVPLRAALEGTVYRGPSALDEFWAATYETWETIQMEIDEETLHGDRVLGIGRLRGRARHTSTDVDSPMAWVITFDGDKVARIQTYVNLAEAREAAERD